MDVPEIGPQFIKENHHKGVKNWIAVFAIILTIVSIILVALSLSLGSKIDQLGDFSLFIFAF